MPKLYYPEEIIDSKFENNNTYYLVKWRGYKTPTWEPSSHIEHRTDLIQKYNDLNLINQLGMKSSGYIYCRVSSKEQSKYSNGHTSLQVQEQEMRKYCEEHNINVIKVVHEVYSARNMNKMKGLQHLCDTASAGQTIYVYDISRFSRNAHHALNILEDLNDRNISVVSITENITYGSASDRHHFRLQLCETAHFSDIHSQKIKASIAFRRARGDYIGRTPYGFKTDVDEKTQMRSMVQNPEEMKIIERIRSLHPTKSPDVIAFTLLAENVKFRGKSPKSSTVKRIIYRFSTDLNLSNNTTRSSKKIHKYRVKPY